MTRGSAASPFCTCGGLLTHYDGPQHFPAGDTIHLWRDEKCRTSLTGPNPNQLMAVLELVGQLLAVVEPVNPLIAKLRASAHLPGRALVADMIEHVHGGGLAEFIGPTQVEETTAAEQTVAYEPAPFTHLSRTMVR